MLPLSTGCAQKYLGLFNRSSQCISVYTCRRCSNTLHLQISVINLRHGPARWVLLPSQLYKRSTEVQKPPEVREPEQSGSRVCALGHELSVAAGEGGILVPPPRTGPEVQVPVLVQVLVQVSLACPKYSETDPSAACS